jgi:hypothetical protein
MRTARNRFLALFAALLPALLCVSALAQGSGTAAPTRQSLSATPDGKFLVDANGKKRLQYLDAAQAFVPMVTDDGAKAQSSLNREPLAARGLTFYPCNCRDECIRWDANGNCLGTYRTCDICVKGSND